MESENTEERDVAEEREGSPVCLRCMAPVDRLGYYCPHCGEASGQLTQYIPFVNLQWQMDIWGRMWRQIWSRDVSIPGRLFRFCMIVWNVPILLIGLLFVRKKKTEDHQPVEDD